MKQRCGEAPHRAGQKTETTMNKIATNPAASTDQKTREVVAEAAHRYPRWTVEVVTAEDGTLSVIAENAEGEPLGFQPATPDGWACLDSEGLETGRYRALPEAFAAQLARGPGG
jgi:hypothetical protein